MKGGERKLGRRKRVREMGIEGVRQNDRENGMEEDLMREIG